MNVSDTRVRSAERTHAPIGVFDSGVGGLTILSALRKELPYENYIYFGDSANCPYGTRSDAEIVELSIRANRFLIEQGVKLIVVACNTASLAALAVLRSTFSVPFVGVVPAVELAARVTKTGRIGIAATNQTVQSLYLRRLMNEFSDDMQTFAVGCPELVTLVEQGKLDGPIVEETVRRALQPILKEDIDVIVLGCTHFPALGSVIKHVAGRNMQVIDNALHIAGCTHSVLDADGLTHPVYPNHSVYGKLEVHCSGDPCAFSSVASKLLGYPIFAKQTLLERDRSGTIL